MELFPRRALDRVTDPASEPLTLSETKLYLRVDDDAEDTLISDMIAAAREAAELYLRQSLITQQWRLRFAGNLPENPYLPLGPVQGIVRVSEVTEEGVSTDVTSDAYRLHPDGTSLESDISISAHHIDIVYTTGFGDDASDVPQSIRHGLLAHVAEIYDNRNLATALPSAVKGLYDPYRQVRV